MAASIAASPMVQVAMVPRGVPRARCSSVQVLAGKKQGGGGGKAQVKVNKRGKVSSRPGPGSPLLEQAMVAQQQQREIYEQQLSTPPPQAQAQAQAAQPPPPSQQQQPAAQPAQQQQPQQQQQQRRGGGGLQETPQVVVDRMFRRVLTFAGLPVLTGLVLFPLFWYLRVVSKVEYPIWVVYVTQAFMFGGGLLGITYGILSTSWDPAREGTRLGWTELRTNLPLLLNRGKDE